MTQIPFPSERTIEDYVFQRISSVGECPVSGDLVDLVVRQYDLKGYGVIDVLKISISPFEIRITVLELKNENLKESHVGQLARYMTGVTRLATRYRRFLDAGWKIFVEGELAGPLDSSSGDFVYLRNVLPQHISIYELTLDMEYGLSSSPVSTGWHNRNESRASSKAIVRKVFNKYSSLKKSIPIAANVVSIGDKNG